MRSAAIVFLLSLFAVTAHAAWPTYIDLRQGQERTINVAGKKHRILLHKVEYEYAPNHWHRIGDQHDKRHLCRARVSLIVDEKAVELYQGAYRMPVTVCGMRLYVENTKRWATQADYQAISGFTADVVLSAVGEGEAWGPEEMLFPLADYRWGSSPYQNTWSSLVPYNSVYYHRGEDFGALPDRLGVRAILAGKVEATPLPNGDGRSNAIVIRHDKNFVYRFSHVNTPHVDASVVKGAQIERGKAIARTGNTYRRAGAQFRDPHFHVNFIYRGRSVSPYPFIVEAYLRSYPDNVIAVAGGYEYTLPGAEVTLDASHTILRDGHAVKTYEWRLSDGRTVEGEKVAVSYDRPGLYTEELRVVTAAGDEDCDFVQVRVWGEAPEKEIAYGWAYHTPVRGLKAGRNVRFWNRLAYTQGEVMIDVGDGSPAVAIDREMFHQYASPGRYTVTLRATGKHGEPITVKMEVVVEE